MNHLLKVSVHISYLEIYNESIIDILTNKENLEIRETKSKAIIIQGLQEIEVKSYEEAMNL